MIPQDSRRALILGSRYLGLGSLEPPGDVLRVRAYARGDDGLARRLADRAMAASALTRADGDDTTGAAGTGSRAVALFEEALAPYAFGHHAYDPFESLAASLDRAAAGDASLERALWAALEGDLFRFAFDGEFAAALEAEKGSDQWRRFAGLNALYRSAVRAVAPAGIVPPAWGSWLRGDDAPRRGREPGGAFLERVLTRPLGSVAMALERPRAPGERLYLVVDP